MASYDGSIRINVDLDAKTFDRLSKEVLNQTSKLISGGKQIGVGFQTGVDNASRSVSRLNNTVKGIITSLGIYLGVDMFKDLGKQALGYAGDLTEVQNVVDVIFGNMADSVNDFASGALKNFGLATLTAKTYVSQLAASFKAMNLASKIGSEGVSEVAVNLTKRIADIASFRNMNFNDVFVKVQSGMAGETEAVKSLGVATYEADMNNFMLQNGLKGNYRELDRSTKIMLLYNKIMQDTSYMQGDFANTSQTFSNQTRVLGERWKELLSLWGSYLIPIITPAIQSLNNLLAIVMGVTKAVADLFGLESSLDITSVSTNTDAYTSLADSTDLASTATEDLAKSTTKAAKAAQKSLAPFHKLNVLTSNKGVGSGSSSKKAKNPTSLNVPIMSTYGEVSSPFDKFLDSINASDISSKVKKIRDSLMGFFNELKEYSPIIKGIASGLGILLAFKGLSSFLTKLGKIGSVAGVLSAFSKAWGLFTFGVENGLGVVGSAGIAIGSLWASFKTFMTGLTPLMKSAVLIAGVVTTFVTLKSAVKNFTLKSVNKQTGEFELSWGNLKTMLLNCIPVLLLVGTTLTAMLGPVGLVITGVAGLVGAFKGWFDAMNEINTASSLADFFDETGVSIDLFADKFKEMYDKQITTNQVIADYVTAIEDSGKKTDIAATKIGSLGIQMEYSATVTKENVDKMKSYYAELTKSVDDSINASVDLLNTYIYSNSDYFKSLGVDVGGLSSTISDASAKMKTEAKSIKDEMDSILAKGTNASKGDWSRFSELSVELSKISDGANRANVKIDDRLSQIASGKINFDNIDTFKQKVKELNDLYSQLKTNAQDSKDNALIALDSLKSKMSESDYNGIKNNIISAFKVNEDEINKQAASDFSVIVGAYNRQKREVFDTAISKMSTGDELLGSLWGKHKDETAVGTKTYSMFEDMDKELKNILGNYGKYDKTAYDSFFNIGKNINDGTVAGINSNKDSVNTAVGAMSTEAIERAKTDFDTHSPSKIFIEIGSFLAKGLAIGITSSTQFALNAMTGLSTTLKTVDFGGAGMFNKGKLFVASFAVGVLSEKATLMETLRGVLNSMLSIFESFYSKVGSSLSNSAGMLSKSKTVPDLALAGVNLQSIKIPKLAKGSVINPNSQFIALLGDQRRGVNIEAPLDTIKQGFRDELEAMNFGSNSGDIVIPVYIGNDLIDEIVVNASNKSKYRGNGK